MVAAFAIAPALLFAALGSALATEAAGVQPPDQSVIADIGRFDQAGFFRHLQCTVALVAPDLVATAAHCVVGGVLRDRPPAGHILLGYDQMHWIEHRREKAVVIPDKTRDLAFICLDAPVSVTPLPVASSAPALGETLVAAGYGAPAAQRLKQQACRLVGGLAGERYVLDCPAAHGSSGGPVLRVQDGRTAVVGVLSRSSEKGSLFVRLTPQTVAAANCP